MGKKFKNKKNPKSLVIALILLIIPLILIFFTDNGILKIIFGFSIISSFIFCFYYITNRIEKINSYSDFLHQPLLKIGRLIIVFFLLVLLFTFISKFNSNAYYVIVEDLPESYITSGFTKKSITALIENQTRSLNNNLTNSVIEISSDSNNISLEVLGNSIYFNDLLLLFRRFFNIEKTIYLNFNKTSENFLICSGSISNGESVKLVKPIHLKVNPNIVDFNSIKCLVELLVGEVFKEIDPYKIISHNQYNLQYLKDNHEFFGGHKNPEIKYFFYLIYGYALLDELQIYEGNIYLNKALNYYSKNIKTTDKESLDILIYSLGNLSLNQGNPSKIIEILNELELKDSYPEIIGVVNYHMGNYDVAIPILEKLLNKEIKDKNVISFFDTITYKQQYEINNIADLVMSYYLYNNKYDKAENLLSEMEKIASEKSEKSLKYILDYQISILKYQGKDDKTSNLINKYLTVNDMSSYFRSLLRTELSPNWSPWVNIESQTNFIEEESSLLDEDINQNDFIDINLTNDFNDFFSYNILYNSTFNFFYKKSITNKIKILAGEDTILKENLIIDLLEENKGLFYITGIIKNLNRQGKFEESRIILNLIENCISKDEYPIEFYVLKNETYYNLNIETNLSTIIENNGYQSDVSMQINSNRLRGEIVENAKPMYYQNSINNHLILTDFAFNKKKYEGRLNTPMIKSQILSYLVFNDLFTELHRINYENLTNDILTDYENILMESIKLDYENFDAFLLLEIVENFSGKSDLKNIPLNLPENLANQNYHLNIANFLLKSFDLLGAKLQLTELMKLENNSPEIRNSVLLYSIYSQSLPQFSEFYDPNIQSYYFPNGIKLEHLKKVLLHSIIEIYSNPYIYNCREESYFIMLRNMLNTYLFYFKDFKDFPQFIGSINTLPELQNLNAQLKINISIDYSNEQ